MNGSPSSRCRTSYAVFDAIPCSMAPLFSGILSRGKALPDDKYRSPVSNFSEIMLCWRMNIEQRNRLRAEAGLPLLNPAVEFKRLDAAIEQVEFEREWQRRRPEFKHQWIGNNRGWLTNAGRWCLARQQVRREMKKISGKD